MFAHTHGLAHCVNPVGQEQTHEPWEQTWDALQSALQAPQFCGSFIRLAQAQPPETGQEL